MKVVAVLFVILFINRLLIIARLRAKHTRAWSSIGSPTFFGSNRGSTLLQYIGLGGDARGLDDQLLNVFIYIHRFGGVLILVTFGCVLLFALVGTGTKV